MRILKISGRQNQSESHTDSLINFSQALSELSISMTAPHYSALAITFDQAHDVGLLLVDMDSPRHVGVMSKTQAFMQKYPDIPVLAYSCAPKRPKSADALSDMGVHTIHVFQEETPHNTLTTDNIMTLTQAIHDLVCDDLNGYGASEVLWHRALTVSGKGRGSDIQHHFGSLYTPLAE